MSFFLVSLGVYAGLTAWISSRVQGSVQEWGFTLAHLALAAAINAHLLWVARRRSLSFLASAPLAFLVVSHVYFTINGIKYFSPILLYPQFELTLSAQFWGAAAGAGVLFLGARLLDRDGGPTTEAMHRWVERYWADVRRLVVVTTLGSVVCKVALFRLGYGSAYTDAAYTEHSVRTYWDFLVLLGNDAFGALSLVFGLMYLVHPPVRRRRPLIAVSAAGGVALQVWHSLLFVKARMIILVGLIIFALVSEVVSRARAQRLLQTLLVTLPVLSLLGLQLTLLIGRFNIPEDTGLRLAIGAVNRRAELTDFATAILVNSQGKAHDPAIITAAVLNTIPRPLLPGKDKLVRDVYTQILERGLGWRAGSGDEMQVDYLDTSFSNGVMAFGYAGFVLVPLMLVLVLVVTCRWVERSFHGLAYGICLIALWLSAMHIEGEWASIPFNFRQAMFFAVIGLGAVAAARAFHATLLGATRFNPGTPGAVYPPPPGIEASPG